MTLSTSRITPEVRNVPLVIYVESVRDGTFRSSDARAMIFVLRIGKSPYVPSLLPSHWQLQEFKV